MANDEHASLIAELKRQGVLDPRLLQALKTVARRDFVPADQLSRAYENRALPIGEGQTISQPLVIALALQALRLSGTERVLEIGTGSGYQTALLCELAREVHSVERRPTLLRQAETALAAYLSSRGDKAGQLHLHAGDGSGGWPDEAPYDGIIVSAACPRVPAPLLEQLAEGGRLILPVGGRQDQVMECWLRTGGATRIVPLVGLESVRFVPLVGEYAWSDADDGEGVRDSSVGRRP